MRYLSTRGVEGLTFEDAVLSGWAEDGGMILPENIPELTDEQWTSWRSLSYCELCKAFLRLMIDEDELPTHELNVIVDRSCAAFKHAEVTPVTTLKAVAQDADISVCELWHGPTLAFKDLGLQLLGNILDFFVAKRSSYLNIMVGTSGDTGSAAIEAVVGRPRLSAWVLFPDERISHIQELQMTSTAAANDNVHLYGVDGTSDDLDRPLQALFTDTNFKQQHHLGSMNSINIIRVLVQAVHYFYAYFRVTNKGHQDPVRFYVPTGAGGHMTGGMIARRMGLPVELFIATNANDFMVRLLTQAELQVADKVVPTNSPSMDIQVPYNIERLLYLVYNNAAVVKAMMEAFYKDGAAKLPENFLQQLQSMVRIDAAAITSDQVASTIKTVYNEQGYLLDPHTAVAMTAAQEKHNPTEPSAVVMACAHPAKFPETISKSLDIGLEEARQLTRTAGGNNEHVTKVYELWAAKVPYTTLSQDEDWEARLRKDIAKDASRRNTSTIST
eukprot:TRINITY_DN8187_c0_g1_i1.p1 TRINITY_DN8187_c0_g1~~TRINITY_DN8187_c0_g1_i1.p1  ORF type:complete len:500 (+),score=119.99 TRINITY_DN8187_c0_g1_i1:52-1551(+)